MLPQQGATAAARLKYFQERRAAELMQLQGQLLGD
jgi:hypothetical protein